MSESIECKVCGHAAMALEEVRGAHEWRYRYRCPNCRAITPKERTPERALAAARTFNRSGSAIWQAIGCPFYRRHNRRGKWVQCESPLHAGLVLTSSFPNGHELDLHMQMCCRSDATLRPAKLCPIAKLCDEKM